MPRRDSVAHCVLDHIQFAYPTNWATEMAESDDGVMMSLQSPGVSFAVMSVYPASEDPTDVVDQALASLREEHPALEEEELFDDNWTEDMQTIESVFLSLDVVVTAWVRAWRLGERVVMVFVQTIEPEEELAKQTFEGLCRSATLVEGRG